MFTICVQWPTAGVADLVQSPAEHVQKIQNANDVQDDLPLDVGIQNVPADVRNTNINVKLGDDRNLIFNTLLTFCVSAMSNAMKMNVVQLIVMKFSDNEVVDAKDVMFKIQTIYCNIRSEKTHNIDQRNLYTLNIFMMVLRNYLMPINCHYMSPMVLAYL